MIGEEPSLPPEHSDLEAEEPLGVGALGQDQNGREEAGNPAQDPEHEEQERRWKAREEPEQRRASRGPAFRVNFESARTAPGSPYPDRLANTKSPARWP